MQAISKSFVLSIFFFFFFFGLQTTSGQTLSSAEIAAELKVEAVRVDQLSETVKAAWNKWSVPPEEGEGVLQVLRQEQAASFLVEIGVENIDEEKIAQAYADNVGKPFTYTIDKKQHVVPGSETGADGAFNAINLGQLVDAVEPSYQRYDFYHSEPTLVADHHEPVAVA